MNKKCKRVIDETAETQIAITTKSEERPLLSVGGQEESGTHPAKGETRSISHVYLSDHDIEQKTPAEMKVLTSTPPTSSSAPFNKN